ncbi:MAG: proline dehydrogenase family protein [Vicinamibacterales bacterium]
MLHLPSKALFHLLAQSPLVRRLASRYGMVKETGFARRFIAGETIDEALVAAKAIQDQGYLLTLDYLGESVRTPAAATAATDEYLRLIRVIAQAGVERNISLKLTQLGLDIDRATCVDNLRRILTPAAEQGFFIRVDMEDSGHTQQTLDIFETLWKHDYRNVGVVLQSYLRRTDADLTRVLGLGARVRLVKGAYKEPRQVAFPRRADVEDHFIAAMKRLLDSGQYHAIATHDPAMIEATIAYARERGIPNDRFEFQMLYGIRRDLQASLLARGYRMRIYLPFGKEWFPYFMRRLGERPSNVGFLLRSLRHEKKGVGV